METSCDPFCTDIKIMKYKNRFLLLLGDLKANLTVKIVELSMHN